MLSRNRDLPLIALLACSLSAAAGGCAQNNVRASAPVAAPPAPSVAQSERPMTTAPDTDATPPVDAAVPPQSVQAASNAPPVTIASTPPVPTPPKPIAEQPPAAEPPARPPAPQISAQLSPGDHASYVRKTEEDVALAEKNLQSTNGKQLNAAQQDLVEKIRSFVAQARDAGKSGDWTRAQNLAQKARVLSIELANSF
jgi:hypothetical protein